MRFRTLLIGVASVLLPLESGLAAEREIAAKEWGSVTQARVLAEVDSGENWLVNGGRFTGEHFSPLDGINDANVENLGLAWSAEIPSFTLSAEPLVVDGVVYVTGSLNNVFALDAATGELLWRFVPELRLDISFGNSYAARYNRGRRRLERQGIRGHRGLPADCPRRGARQAALGGAGLRFDRW